MSLFHVVPQACRGWETISGKRRHPTKRTPRIGTALGSPIGLKPFRLRCKKWASYEDLPPRTVR